MKTVAVIAEYNPFHNGHLYHLKKIREEFGADTAIIAIMSGNFTQRGEFAIMDKWSRAKAAVECGINLVLELPFPYSMASAEFFAMAGVHIANELKIVDTLSFGSECADLWTLSKIAKNTLSEDFSSEIARLSDMPENSALGYARLRELAYEGLFGKCDEIIGANNILGIEYIKSLTEKKSNITPHTVMRSGGDYNDANLCAGERQSATAIRTAIYKNDYSALDYLPNSSKNTVLFECEAEKFPCESAKLDSAVISHLRLSSPTAECSVHDAAGGLYNRLVGMSREATDIQSLIDLSVTKKYTIARIKRAIWFSFFGVTSSDVKEPPRYTQILAMDKIGQALLKKIKKVSDFTLLTRPSAALPCDSAQSKQKSLCDKADSVFQMTMPRPRAASEIYKAGPFVKCD